MSRSSALVWATFAAIIGGGGLIYLLTTISPWHADGTQNLPAIVGFFGATFLLLAGIASVAALALHERVPLLAGITPRQPGAMPAPEVAIRQGVLLSVALCTSLLLSMLGLLDPAFALVAILIAALLEAIWQSIPALRHTS
jgi:hypothetical protein